MKKFIVKYQVIIGFLLGILATLAAQTTSTVDDKAVAAAQDLYQTYISETTVIPVSSTLVE